ncbi:BTB/POZ domain-containing protein 6-B-like [Topomyia yanbarensis]|uniref:BTB/POZ domain-containing protein 6-B-like n=1 Tax=Topomyia yanbarensis TaxID=2498891 RepID=UPI00273BDA5A|nr:BTB/POZ domain-containing protein 6-B-like [Topomyia yanbarensis]
MSENFSKRHRKALEAKRAKNLAKLTRNPTAGTTDWQISLHNIQSRSHYLWENGTLTDCSFLVGREPKKQKLIAAHKLILAMSSPVFYTMFYGSMPETNMIINVTDLEHSAFSTLLEYIYTDTVVIESVDDVFELYRAAKKYMLQYVAEKCITHLMGKANPTNVLRVYELATFFDELQLKELCLRIIRNQTMEVIQDDGLENVELETLMMLMEQEQLSLISELELFNAINRYAVKNAASLDPQPNQDQVINEASPSTPSEQKLLSEESSELQDQANNKTAPTTPSQEQLLSEESSELKDPVENQIALTTPSQEQLLSEGSSELKDQVKNETAPTAPSQEQLVGEGSSESSDKLSKEPVADETKEPQTDSAPSEVVERKPASAITITIRDIVKRVRFLTMSPKQFAEGPIKTTLLTQPEMFAILANISSPDSGVPMPDGFSTSRARRSTKAFVFH